MKPLLLCLRQSLVALCTLCCSAGVLAQEATIRKNIAERLPQLRQIDEVRKSPLPGLFEIRVNDSEIYYTDAQGNYLVQGQIIDTKQRRNLTEERIDKLTAVKFEALPLQDAITIVRGKGERKLAVFQDPNCGYCKRFERDLQKVDNVTMHLFLYPILGADSADKARGIWCARDRAKAWNDWMLRDVPVAAAAAMCNSAVLERNVALGRKHNITGTPTLVFVDGSRVPGAVDAQQVEKLLAQARP